MTSTCIYSAALFLHLIVVVAKTESLQLCNPFSATFAGPNQYCAIEVCGHQEVVLSGCVEDGGKCEGSTTFAVYDSNHNVVGTNTSQCGSCSRVSFFGEASFGCSIYNLYQRCSSEKCNGTTAVVGAAVDNEAAQQFALLAWSLTFNDTMPIAGVFGWNISCPLDDWDGIETDGNGNVTVIDSYYWRHMMQPVDTLQGPLTDDTFANLPHLVVLEISLVTLTGTIPAALFSCSALAYLDLWETGFLTGSIPANLPNSLYHFSVRGNSLTGSAASFPVTLEYAELTSNMLTGSLPLPFSFNYLVNSNYFTGSVPNFGKLDIYWFYVGVNLLEGSLGSFPEWLGEFSCEDNSLTGTLPTIPNSTSYFDVSHNHFIGTVPILDPLNASYFDFSHNSFSGVLPSSLDLISDLIANNNKFTGPLPALSDSTVGYVLHDNMLTGTLPTTYFESLIQFDISNNPSVTGTIPEVVCGLPNLVVFQALGCNFTCYYPCASTTAYMDFMVPYSMQFPYDDPSYQVCNNEEIETLCNLDEALGISTGIPSLHEREYFSESVEYIAEPYFTAEDAIATFNYVVSDPTSTFSRFELIFNPRSNNLLGDIPFLTITCANDGNVFYYYGSLPGIGQEPIFSLNCPMMHIVVEIVNLGNLYVQPGVYFTVKRFSYKREWDCSDGSGTAYNPCEWYGIDCAENTVVTSLALDGMFLSGTIPDAIGKLSYLTTVDFSSNSLSGSVPSSLLSAKDSLVKMDVSNNQLSFIPTEIGELGILEYLYLSGNEFSGSLPTFLADMTQLVELQFRSNRFSGSFPEGFCNMSSTIIAAQDNQFLCSSACAAVELGSCVTPESSDRFTVGAKIGVAVGCLVAAFLGLVGGYWYHHRQLQYADLPLHKRLHDGKLVVEQDVIANVASLHRVDTHNQTVIDFLYQPKTNRIDLISEEALYFIVINSLHFDLESGDKIDNESEHGFAWARMVQQSDDKSFAVIKRVLAEAEEQLDLLVNGTDMLGRRCLDIACGRVGTELRLCTFLNRRFELKPGPPEHKSATSVVVFSVDHGENGSDSELPKQVALKFMKNRQHYISEVEMRASSSFDPQFVVAVLDHYDGDDCSDKNVAFREASIKRSFRDYPYCLVMPRADANIEQVITKQYVVGNDWDTIKHLLKTLCNCLVHIHEKHVVHGDIKPLNMMLVDNAIRLIDFDASTNFGPDSFDYAGAKYSSGYLPPELFFDGGKRVKTFDINAHGERIGVRYVSSGESDPLLGCKVISALHVAGYELVLPSPAQDMWAVGVVLYQLCSGFPLFLTSFEGNVASREGKKILEWHQVVKEEKLSYISDKYARNLVSLLLSKDPMHRPSAERVLKHPFITGHTPPRLQGDAAAFDVFISYRVSSDMNHAEALYNALTDRGLKVWWDRKCLLPGQPWEEGFCNGLVNSCCFVCLLSKGAINHPTRTNANFTCMEETSECDNVLLEWRLALELRTRHMIEGIYPVMIGDKQPDVIDVETNSPVYSDYNKGSHPHPLPDVCVRAVEDKLCVHLESQGLGSPFGDRLTVQRVVKDIISNQGGHIRNGFATSFRRVCDGIVDMRTAIACNHSSL